MVIDRKRGQHVARGTWAEGKLMEGETWMERERRGRKNRKGCRKVQYGGRTDRQREKERALAGQEETHVFKERHN